ncbi:hypothetical protein FCN77_17390 [Arthrobacter sp. 24S4-2]|uniref:hypothetical protein n=1 Tax=Arthrobacter sp. 24S4-2 TaxID=2575374 RepID=UPI0010C7D25A|nr:hypothetical protein [Arthrobacter sp. 24S4-2]QCO99149.1 hypothetical protein FCN77_17390 [Arthrobacter sp. 24S4-2]
MTSLVVVLRLNGVLDGILGLCFAAGLVLLLPTARYLSLRLLLNGLLAMGFAPLTWWVPERILGTDHGTLLMALSAGILSWWVLSARPGVPRLRRLMPKAEWIDAVPFLAGGLAASSLGTMLAVRSPLDALSLMTGKWDYQSHFNIYFMIRSHGGVIPTTALPSSGGTWGFSEYPQGFHALLATLADLIRPDHTALDAELVSYVNLQAVVCVLTVVLVTAGLCALPAVRRRPTAMAPVIAVAASAWIFGPGSLPVYDGFANFYLACGLATATVLALLNFGRRIPLWGLAGVGAGLVGIANNWVLLISLVAVVCIGRFWHVLRRPGGYAPAWWRTAAVVAAFTAAGVLLPVIQLSPLVQQSQQILGLTGGIELPDFGIALAVIALVVALGFANTAVPAANASLGAERRGTALASFGLFVPIGLCLWLAVSQSASNGAVSYYFYKYLIAVVLFSWPVAVAAVASILPPRSASRVIAGNGRGLTVALCVLALAATQFFGFSVTGLADAGLPPTARAVTEMEKQAARLKAAPEYVARLLAAARQPQPEDSVYIVAQGTMDRVLAARWHWTMRGRSTSKTTALSPAIGEIYKNYSRAPEIIARLLAEDPALTVIVDPELYEPVRQRLAEQGLEGRLLRLGAA